MTKSNVKENGKSPEMEGKFRLLLTLITLLKKTRHKNKKTELEFLMVNQTYNMVPYNHCAYWEYSKGKIILRNISGLAHIDSDGPYTQWLARVIKSINDKHMNTVNADQDNSAQSYSTLIPLTINDCPEKEKAEWKNWSSKNSLLIIFKNHTNNILGGLWLDREESFGELEKAMLEDLADGYAHALNQFFIKSRRSLVKSGSSIFSLSSLGVKIFFIGLIIALLIPVRMSATAPAEIVASKPDVINVPFDGVIDNVGVVPGQKVQKGDVLVYMDSTVLENKLTMTSEELVAAEIALQKTQRESLTDRAKLAEIAILKSRLDQKNSEVNFAREMMQRAEIKAERDGIVIFPDPNALRGKPVQTGEQIMLLADPDDSELLIRIPVDSMIDIDEEVPARFFLNVMPLDYKKARYESIGYQATPDSGGLMTYKVRAKFTDGDDKMRIGWTGTGKVYGSRTILAFNILRRPFVALRSKLGI